MAKHAATTNYSQPSTFVVCAFRRNRECRISANTCRFHLYNPLLLMPYNSTQLPESCKGYQGLSTDLHSKSLPEVDGLSGASFLKPLSKKYCEYSNSFRHYVFTRILHNSLAVLNCASMKAEVWTCPDQLASLEQASGIAGPVLP
ncbi:hypothetical protein T11_17871 [Trichinella zimbabwensis]|uniref:Uncharacterized protein n=1 Tax=Trichinella zimbabwensis TaxID=268475 RepID=A0A0V1I2V4_9BILA|nr:hypothetical protein T11_17871 [Trichinella zimbabwensis]